MSYSLEPTCLTSMYVLINSINVLGHWANVPSYATFLLIKRSLWARAQYPCGLIHEIDSNHLAQHPPISIGVAI
jgi:hypothetical protein